jgi:hypothetical protein
MKSIESAATTLRATSTYFIILSARPKAASTTSAGAQTPLAGIAGTSAASARERPDAWSRKE